jgi:hypothetical protein
LGDFNGFLGKGKRINEDTAVTGNDQSSRYLSVEFAGENVNVAGDSFFLHVFSMPYKFSLDAHCLAVEPRTWRLRRWFCARTIVVIVGVLAGFWCAAAHKD